MNPWFYIAVGRRLKYPLSLVSAKNHLFVRWEDQETRLNIEAAAVGMSTYDDAHYRKWAYPMTTQEEKDNGFIKSMTAAEECAVFMSIRGHCLMAAGRTADALAAHEKAARRAPEAHFYGFILDNARQEAAARSAPQHPDFSKMQREYQRAKQEALQREAQRRQRQLDGEPTPDMLMPGQQVPGFPFKNNRFGLPSSHQNR